tara:strand:+ start:6348 stop:7262 length:915 start_codon:yes stop_codon:yes gene_type:complete
MPLSRISTYLKLSSFILSFSSGVFSETSFPGMDIFTSSANISMGGAGYLKPSPLSSNINPSISGGKVFSASIVKYPAGIASQNIGISFLFKNNTFGKFLINNISYGIFEGYNENLISTGTYSASDTKITASYGKRILRLPIKLGVQSSFYLSNYGGYTFNIYSFSAGLSFRAKEQRFTMGMSIHNLSTSSSDLVVDLHPRLVISGSKKLKHLPLSVFLDLTSENSSDLTAFIGGEFDINKNFQFRIGSSNRKFNQNIKKDIFSSVIGASGFGFGYKKKDILINYSIYVFGTGALSQGMEINIAI